MRFVVIPNTVFFHNAGRSTSKISWRVVDVSKFPRVTVATCNDQTTADRIAAHLNGGTARAEADRLRAQLFEAREQRDEARADAAGMRNKWQAREDTLTKWKDEALAARQHVCATPVYSSTPPHDHVVMSLANYRKLVTERDEALAKYAACVDTVSFVDGRWIRTS